MATPRLPPPPQELDFFSDGPEVVTVYLSPHCPELRSRVWLEFVGFPRHLWSQRRAAACLVRFGGVAHLDAAEFRRSGRMVVEARVTRAAEVPKRVAVMESVRAPPGAVLPVGTRRYSVHLVVLSAEPVHEEEDGKGRMQKQRTAMAPDDQVGSSTGLAANGATTKHGDGEVGTQERPESIDCYL